MIPSSWQNVPDWMRMVAAALNPIIRGYPFVQLSSDPASPEAGFTYYNTTTNKVRTWDGTIWNNLY